MPYPEPEEASYIDEITVQNNEDSDAEEFQYDLDRNPHSLKYLELDHLYVKYRTVVAGVLAHQQRVALNQVGDASAFEADPLGNGGMFIYTRILGWNTDHCLKCVKESHEVEQLVKKQMQAFYS